MAGIQVSGRWAPRVAGFLAVLLVAAGVALADRVVMKDGRVFEGRITEETRTSVTIDARIANIPTTMTLSKREMRAIEKGAVAEPTPEAAPEPAREEARERPRERRSSPDKRSRPSPSETTRYIVVPLHGVFGEDIAPPGVADAIQYASRRGIDNIVFHLDSPGGYTWAADEIADIMMDAPSSIRKIAYIEEAISASIWVVFGCDDVFVAPGATIGAAVTYSQDNTTGATEVDQKLNSALAGKIAAMAERTGRSGVLARAMFLPEAEAWAVEVGDGEHRIVDERPSVREGVIEIDGRDTVLTLTGEEAIRWGIAAPGESVEAVGEALGLDGWTKHNDYGDAAMRKAAEALARGEGNVPMMVERLGALVGTINSAIDEAAAMAPEGGSYYIHPDSGLFTPESQKQWQERTDASLAACRRALDRLDEYAGTQGELKELGVDIGAHDLNVRDLRGTLQRRIQELRRNRDKRYY